MSPWNLGLSCSPPSSCHGMRFAMSPAGAEACATWAKLRTLLRYTFAYWEGGGWPQAGGDAGGFVARQKKGQFGGYSATQRHMLGCSAT